VITIQNTRAAFAPSTSPPHGGTRPDPTTPFRDSEDDTSDLVVHSVPGTVGGDGCDTAAVGDALSATRGHGEFAFFDYLITIWYTNN